MRYLITNSPAASIAAPVAVTTGTAIKTLLQVTPAAKAGARIVAWGVSFSGAAVAAGIVCELIETTVAATVTAHVASGIIAQDPEAIALASPATFFTLGVSATGITATAEGSVTTTRLLDVQQISPVGGWSRYFDPDARPFIQAGTHCRIRVTAGAAVNAYAWMLVEAWANAS